MKRSITIPLAVVLSLVISGCIINGTPLKDPVFVFPGTTRTFEVLAIADSDNLVWFLDDVQVQSGGHTFDYTAPEGNADPHTLVVKLQNAVGNDTHAWNILTDADEWPSSPNNPHVTKGPGPWFEGWYTRVSDVAGSRSVAIIGASSLPKGQYFVPGQYLPGYINVLVSEGDGAPTLSFTVYPEQTISLVDGEPVHRNPDPLSPADFEWVAEGFGTITQDRVDISIPGVLDLFIQTENRRPYHIAFPDVGPYGALDFLPLPLRWWIHSLGSDAVYQYTIHGDSGPETASGVGYAHHEKNWGAGFPIGWIWTQGIAADNEAQFVMSTAEVDFGLFILNAWIAGYRSPVVSWDFNYSLSGISFYTERDACAGTFLFEIMSGNQKLTFDSFAPTDTFGDVSTPSENGFEPETGVESFCATMEVSAYEDGVLIDRQMFYNSALEYGTGYVCE